MAQRGVMEQCEGSGNAAMEGKTMAEAKTRILNQNMARKYDGRFHRKVGVVFSWAEGGKQ